VGLSDAYASYTRAPPLARRLPSAYLHARLGDSRAHFLVIPEHFVVGPWQERKARRTSTVPRQSRRVAPGEGRWGKELYRSRSPRRLRKSDSEGSGSVVNSGTAAWMDVSRLSCD
jgi:hypothetical protein